jgi:hypothetical protein
MLWHAVQTLEVSEDSEQSFVKYADKHVLRKEKVIKLKCAEDTYNNESRIKYTVQTCEDLDYEHESKVCPIIEWDLVPVSSGFVGHHSSCPRMKQSCLPDEQSQVGGSSSKGNGKNGGSWIVQVLISMIDDLSMGRPIKMMQPPPPKHGASPGGFPAAGMAGAPSPTGVPGPFGAHSGMFTGQMAGGYMQTQQSYVPGAGMPLGYQQPGMQPMGMPGYQQQQHPGMQQGMHQAGLAFLQ